MGAVHGEDKVDGYVWAETPGPHGGLERVAARYVTTGPHHSTKLDPIQPLATFVTDGSDTREEAQAELDRIKEQREKDFQKILADIERE